GDFLTPAFHPFRKPPVNPTRGPTITAAIDFLDGDAHGNQFFIEDGGFPDLARELLGRLAGKETFNQGETALSESAQLLTRLGVLDQLMPWFAQGRDAANGILSIKNGKLFLQWDIEESQKTIEAIVRAHEHLARATAGVPLVPLTWTLSH